MANIVDAPWDDLVTKDNLAAFEAKTDARLASFQGQVDVRFAQVDATIERALRQQTIWLVSAMFVFNGLLAAWITAFH